MLPRKDLYVKQLVMNYIHHEGGSTRQNGSLNSLYYSYTPRPSCQWVIGNSPIVKLIAEVDPDYQSAKNGYAHK